MVFFIAEMQSDHNSINIHCIVFIGGVELFGIRERFVKLGNGVMLVAVKSDCRKVNITER